MKTLKFISLMCISIFFLSCKKISKEETTVNFHLYNPATNEPFVGVVVKVYQQEDVSPKFGAFSDDKYENTVIWEGKTDANGKASHTFKTQKKAKFTYWQYVDPGFAHGMHIYDQPSYGSLQKEKSNEVKYLVIIKDLTYVRWIKNVNCFDENDQMRWRTRRILSGHPSNWSAWGPVVGAPSYPTGYYLGCFENTYSLGSDQDIREIEMEVTRNGVTTIVRDTFYLTGLNGIDTMKLHY